jgi:phospholipid transport system substrate-binding protein
VKDQWKIYDVSIEGISLVVSYRASFAQEIRNYGLDGLLEHLAARNANGCVARQESVQTTDPRC